MKLIKKFAFVSVALGVLVLSGCKKTENGIATTQASSGHRQIAVIAKSTVNAYWKAVESGARLAAQEDGVDILWTGPDSETNHSQQANMVDNMVNRGVSGIVLAPTNVDALVRPVDSAVANGVPVVLIDSTVNSKKPVSVIATDNYQAGRQAGDALIAAIGNKKSFGGKVIMLRFLEGSGSTQRRESGFADRIKEAGLNLIDSPYIKGGGSTTDAADTADALLQRFTVNGQLQVDGIFASNQPTAIGMLRKIQQFKAQGTKVEAPFVGFDSHEILLAGIRSGEIAAIITQDPRQMGYLGVKTMDKILNNQVIDPTISTATATVTKANIDDPKIKAITLE